MRRFTKVLTMVLAGLSVGACAFSPQLQRMAVDHDQMVAQTEDELMLRNILRARFRYPLHFTTITEMSGDVGLSAGASLGADVPTQGSVGFSPGVDGSISTRPSFRAAVLANEKFQRGLQRPVTGELLAYYLDAGWRDELLMSLFVERLDVIDKQSGRRLATVYNDPDDAYDFQSVICNFMLKPHRIDDRFDLASASDIFRPGDLRGLSQTDRSAAVQDFVNLLKDERVAFDTEKLSFKTNSSYSVTFTRGHNRCEGADFSRSKMDWRRNHPAAGLAAGEVRNGMPVLAGGALLDPDVFNLVGPSSDGEGGFNARFFNAPSQTLQAAGQPGWRDVSLEVHFRSVQDVIYFLGEYVRAGDGAYQIPREYYLTQCGATSTRPVRRMRWIMQLHEGDEKGGVNTRFLGKRYWVPSEENEGGGRCGLPGGESSRSLQVMSLVQQLLNLNKSADQLPTSISVRAAP